MSASAYIVSGEAVSGRKKGPEIDIKMVVGGGEVGFTWIWGLFGFVVVDMLAASNVVLLFAAINGECWMEVSKNHESTWKLVKDNETFVYYQRAKLPLMIIIE